MANIIMGSHAGTGVGSLIPTRFPSQPPLAASVMTPYAAAIDRTFMIAALTATASERNTDMSRTNDSRTTPPINHGSRLAVCSLSSMKAAVVPPTDASTPVPATAAGMTSSRSVCTRSSVASSCGPVVGTTDMTAASPRSFSTGGTTVATPSVAAASAASRPTASEAVAALPAPARSTATRNGPLAPGPKLSLMRS